MKTLKKKIYKCGKCKKPLQRMLHGKDMWHICPEHGVMRKEINYLN